VFIIVVIGGSWALGEISMPAGIGAVLGIVIGVVRYWQLDHSDQIPELTISDASTREVRKYTDEFDSDGTAGSTN
jgi:NhaP-type Na+/H+ or K+/H+ antiporter